MHFGGVLSLLADVPLFYVPVFCSGLSASMEDGSTGRDLHLGRMVDHWDSRQSS
jgi:hypothetical protein